MVKRKAGSDRSLDLNLNLIYIHGTNGSGKSSIARYCIMCAGGTKRTVRHPETQANVTYTRRRLALVGKYTTSTGGADGVQPYSLVPETAVALLKEGHDVLIEGLMTPGIQTCQDLHDQAVYLGAKVLFMRLEIGYYQALQNVLRRRELAHNDKPYDPTNLRKKQDTVLRWMENLAREGLPTLGYDFNNALGHCLDAFGLTTEGATGVFE